MARRRLKGSKAAAQKRHAARRAAQRHAEHLTGEQLQALGEQIRNNGATFVARQSLRVTIWRVKLPSGEEVPVVYDSRTKQIVTFLTDDMVAD